MLKWIHHILEPHCQDCREEAEAAKVCKSCDSLIHQLEMTNFENRRLVDVIASITKPVAPTAPEQRETVPIKAPINWRIMKQTLEAEDRKAAALMREKAAEAEMLKAKASQVDQVASDVPRAASGGLQVNINPAAQNQSNDAYSDVEKLERELGVQ